MRTSQRYLLIVLAWCIVISALIGICVLAFGQKSWFGAQGILTTCVLGIATLCCLACEQARVPNRLNILSLIGIILIGFSTIGLLIGIWSQIPVFRYWSITASLACFAVATSHVCLLSIARLPIKFRWLPAIAYTLVYGLAAMLACLAWLMLDDALYTVMGLLAILNAAVSLMILLLHRLNMLKVKTVDTVDCNAGTSLADIDREIELLEKRLDGLRVLRVSVLGVAQRTPD